MDNNKNSKNVIGYLLLFTSIAISGYAASIGFISQTEKAKMNMIQFGILGMILFFISIVTFITKMNKSINKNIENNIEENLKKITHSQIETEKSIKESLSLSQNFIIEKNMELKKALSETKEVASKINENTNKIDIIKDVIENSKNNNNKVTTSENSKNNDNKVGIRELASRNKKAKEETPILEEEDKKFIKEENEEFAMWLEDKEDNSTTNDNENNNGTNNEIKEEAVNTKGTTNTNPFNVTTAETVTDTKSPEDIVREMAAGMGIDKSIVTKASNKIREGYNVTKETIGSNRTYADEINGFINSNIDEIEVKKPSRKKIDLNDLISRV